MRFRFQHLLALLTVLSALPIFSIPAMAVTPAKISIHVGLVRAPSEEFTWGSTEIDLVHSAVNAVVDSWNRSLLRSKMLSFTIDSTPVELEEFKNCDFSSNFRAFLASKNQRSVKPTNVLILLNPSSLCSANGLSKVNGNQILITRNGLYSKLVDYYRIENRAKFSELFKPRISTLIAHELGHSLGFLHAATLTCLQSVASTFTYETPSVCLSNIYGDPTDIMGSGSIECTNPANEVIPASLTLASKLSAKLVSIRTISKPTTLVLSQPGQSAKGAFKIPTRFGDAVIEFHSAIPQLQCTEGVLAPRPMGIEIRYLGKKLTNLVSNQLGIGGDGASIGTVALNRSPDPNSLFLSQDLRFIAGDRVLLPGTQLALFIRNSTISGLEIQIVKKP